MARSGSALVAAFAFLALGLAHGISDARAQSAAPAAPPAPPAPEMRTHAATLRYDGGASHALGIGYLYLGDFPPREPFWWGLGGDVHVRGRSLAAPEAVAANVVARVVGGHAPPIALELGLGPYLAGGRVGAFGHAGIYLSLIYMDIGYSYQQPLGPFDRPDWLSSHQLSFRVQIPVRSAPARAHPPAARGP
jgi:hypothetical protein